MQTLHPTLLVGPADWAAQRLPRAEYERRLAQVWIDHPRAGGMIVYGDPRDHAALAYLTHFTPKLEPAVALLAKASEPRLLVGGGANMIDAAWPLTFVRDLVPLRDIGTAVTQWLESLPGDAEIVAVNSDAMPPQPYLSLDRALAARAVRSGDEHLAARMRIKSACERTLMRDACAMLARGATALQEAFSRGDAIDKCVLHGEHAAIQAGAQDVRSLFSVDGGRTLRPFDGTTTSPAGPTPVYLAVRHDGYWAETVCQLGSALDALTQRAQRIVAMLVSQARPGLPLAAWHACVEAERRSFAIHPVTARSIARPIGLSLDDQPMCGNGQVLAAGETWALQVGLRDAGHGAFATAIIAVTATGAECLWPLR